MPLTETTVKWSLKGKQTLKNSVKNERIHTTGVHDKRMFHIVLHKIGMGTVTVRMRINACPRTEGQMTVAICWTTIKLACLPTRISRMNVTNLATDLTPKVTRSADQSGMRFTASLTRVPSLRLLKTVLTFTCWCAFDTVHKWLFLSGMTEKDFLTLSNIWSSSLAKTRISCRSCWLKRSVLY